MPEDVIRRLVTEAERDGITLRWAILHLTQLLVSGEFPRGAQDAMTVRIQREALATVLLAARDAYSVDGDAPEP